MSDATNEQSITLLIKPGTATTEDIAEFLYEIGKLYRLVGGGGGLTWQVSRSTKPGELEIRGVPK